MILFEFNNYSKYAFDTVLMCVFFLFLDLWEPGR